MKKQIRIKTYLENGEVVLRKGLANLQNRHGKFPGYLILTNYRVIFEGSGNSLIRNSDLLSQIDEMELGWTKILKFIPVLPNAVVISYNNGQLHRYTVWGRNRWLDEIKEQKDKNL